MTFVSRPFRYLALSLMGGLALASGCGNLPPGMLPDYQTPEITTQPGAGSSPTSDWRVQPRPGASPTTSPSQPTPVRTPSPVATPAPVRTPAPVATPAPVRTPAPAPTSAPVSTDLSALEDYILQQCNVERAKVGAKSLTMDPTLRPLARSRSQDMAVRNYFDHVTPDGKKVFDMLRELGYPYSTAGENIAMNTYPVSSSAQEVFKAWMNSSGHKANILAAKYGRIGVGAYRRTSDGAIYYTQVFTN